MVDRLRRGFSVASASESSSSDSSESLSPLMLRELRRLKDDGGLRPLADPGESMLIEEGVGELAALRRA